jgi:hypothetical protein
MPTQLHVIYPAASYVPGGTLEDIFFFCEAGVPNRLQPVVLDITTSPFSVAEVEPSPSAEWQPDYIAATKIINGCNGDVIYVAEYITEVRAAASCCGDVTPVPPLPNTISNLWLWLKSDVGVTGTAPVTAWADQSGNARNFTSESGKEPVVELNAVNGLPIVKRGSINASMLSAANFPDITVSGITVFMLAKQSNAGGLDSTGTFITAGSIQNILIARNGGLGGLRAGANTTNAARIDTTSGIAEDTFYTIRLVTNNTIQRLAVNNGAEVTANNAAQSYIGTPIQLFALSSSNYGNKGIAEIIIFNRVLNSTEIANMEAYLRNRYKHY